MATYIEVDQLLADKVKREMVAGKCLDSRHRVIRNKDSKTVKFPIIADLYRGSYPVVTVHEDSLRHAPPPNISTLGVRSYDLVGNIAILETPDSSVDEQAVAKMVQQVNPGVSTVLKRADTHTGVFRTQRLSLITGIPTRVARFCENGCRFEIDVEKVYFSIRQSTERMRVARQIVPGERVLVMFSGAAPFPCVLARHSQAGRIVGIELNPEGHRYGLKNVRQNRLESKVALYQGDVADVAPELVKGEYAALFDRIVMPLPKTSLSFLELAIGLCRPGGVIHLYTFGTSDGIAVTPDEIGNIFARNGRAFEVRTAVKNGASAPGIWRLCRDIVVY